MSRTVVGLVVVGLLAIWVLWKIIGIAFVMLRLAFYVLVFIFLCYVLYVIWGALMRMTKNDRR